MDGRKKEGRIETVDEWIEGRTNGLLDERKRGEQGLERGSKRKVRKEAGFYCAVDSVRQDGGSGMHSPHASWNVTILHLFPLQLGKKPVPLTATLADPDKINSWCLVPTAGQLILPHNPLISLAIHLFGTCILPRCSKEMALQGAGCGGALGILTKSLLPPWRCLKIICKSNVRGEHWSWAVRKQFSGG